MFIIIGILITVIISVTIIGTSLYDIRAIRQERALAIHPYAKKWRRRPLVSIVIHGTPTDECLASIKKNNYRKKEIITDVSRTPKGEYIIQLQPTTILESTAILSAVRSLNNQPDLQYVEIHQHLLPPTNLWQLFNNYRFLVQDIFRKSRNGIGITLRQTPANALSRRKHMHVSYIHTVHNTLYESVAMIAKIILSVAMTYLLYIGFLLRQPEALLTGLIMFGIFMIYAIWTFTPLSFARKIYYSLLLPVSLFFFVVAAWISTVQILLGLIVQMVRILQRTSKPSRV